MFISQAYYCNHIHKQKKFKLEQEKSNKLINSELQNQNTTVIKQKMSNNWNKKGVFYSIWIILNLVVLSSLFHFISKTDWLFLYFVVTFIYCSLYWMLAELVFNKLFVKN